ncbi:glycosyltransferase family 2 protein [Winogradskyella psychrotolerans]|uniref:glycosyltransferase family 2 protein n=1 Tax=Winogradskyella psychrotolerans TaxID=1344585 RepID=UPI001C079E40|nr:glycosyltransferase [Winogradskyella psychrotolerans]MBU2929559.1 glycosyltransferase [Winogradskyella psychrotolerans]
MNKQTKPLVSVSVVTYNHASYIKQCLDGILMQKTTFPFEIILGEDDSSDGTRAICKNYAERFPDKIRLFLRSRKDVIKINGKPTGRFNFMENLKACQGKYIALCEGDDYWTDPLKLQKQVDFLEGNSDFSGNFHDTLMINENHINSELKPWRVYDKQIFKLEDTLSITALFHTSSFLFRRTNLIIPSWFKSVQSVDMALFTILASTGNLFRIDDVMSVYRKNATGITNNVKPIDYHNNRIKLFKHLNDFLKDRDRNRIFKIINIHEAQLKRLTKEKSLYYRLKKRLRCMFKQ